MNTMERNFNLIREILMQAEAAPARTIIQEFTCDGFDELTIIEHVQMLIEVGFFEGEVNETMLGPAGFLVRRITWEGHDFLANAKNNTIWKKVMAESKEKGMSTSLVVLNGLLTKAAQKYLGLD